MQSGVIGERPKITIEQIWLAGACGDRTKIQNLLASSRDRSTGAISLAARALEAILSGEVPVGTTLMERAVRRATPTEAEYLLDLLVPLIASRGDFEASSEYLAQGNGRVERLVPAFIAQRALLTAAQGHINESRHYSADSINMLAGVEEAIMRGRILSRLAVAAYYRSEFDAAYELALECAQWADVAGSCRMAAIAYTVLCHIAHCIYQDADLATHYANEVHNNADLAGDLSIVNRAIITRLVLAAELADVALVEALSAVRNHPRLPEQYAEENFNVAIVGVLRAGWAGRFEAAHTALDSARKMKLTLPQKSTCDVLDAIVYLASWDLGKTRRLARLVISQTIAPRSSEHLHDERRRQTARTIAALLCMSIGDTVRGRRALKHVRNEVLLGSAHAEALVEADGIREDAAPAMLRGYIRYLNNAIKASAAYRPKAILSAAEIEVLHALREGTTLAQIAAGLGKSPKTVRCQVASIYAKLDVSNRTQALRRAAELGLAQSTYLLPFPTPGS
jgi:DNA-binding NarL/FixJ family response regulator